MANRDNPQVQFQWLLEELCIAYGFCLPSSEEPRLRALLALDPEGFTDAVFEVEGMDPRLYKQLRRVVRDTVDKHLRRWAD